MKYDAVLLETPLDGALDRIQISNLLDTCKGDKLIPIEMQAENSTSMGFISLDMAEAIDYSYDGGDFEQCIKEILEDMENETEDCVYKYDIFDIYLGRGV